MLKLKSVIAQNSDR